MHGDDPIEHHFPRLRPDQKKALAKLGIRTLRDLLYHLPSRYEAAGSLGAIAGVSAGAEVTLIGTVRKPDIRKTWKSRRPIAEAYLEDASGKIKMMWFSQPYIAKTLRDGLVVKVSGKVAGTGSKVYLANPSIDVNASLTDSPDPLFTEVRTPSVLTSDLYPVYPESQGISSLWLHHAAKRLIAAGVHEMIPDPVPLEILARYHLPSLSTALIFIHTPSKESDAAVARKRFAFEEIFALQVMMHKRRTLLLEEKALPVLVDRRALASFVASFPFPATSAQERAIEAIVADFEKTRPMLRLLEGDVGSGKTAVAAATSYLVATSRPTGRLAGALQVAYLCPTEILAKQHFSTFVSYFRTHPIPIGLVTGSECRVFPSRVPYEESAKLSKATFRKRVKDGLIPIVIGTHAIIEKTLEFKYLAYVIIDEQHRFGTSHRRSLATKALAPHLLSMTATPIPRTLALTLYGDLDLTLLDEMPLGRKRVITEIVAKDKREVAYTRIREELAKKHQAYVICPRIDEPDPAKELALQAKSVKAEAARLKKEVFPTASIGILHSKMTPDEKETTMKKFEAGTIEILVATSVVEVGVNVPNATVILIEGAERFGLAQLHQLRGRVIRSTHQSYCFVLPETLGQVTRDRLQAFVKAKNGFELAEYDLELRGAGELAGGKQWGVSDVAMEALKNLKLVEAARGEAAELVARDPELATHPALAARVGTVGREMHLE